MLVRKSVFGCGQGPSSCLQTGKYTAITFDQPSLQSPGRLTPLTPITRGKSACYFTGDADTLWAMNLATQFYTAVPPCQHTRMKTLALVKCYQLHCGEEQTDYVATGDGSMGGREESMKSVQLYPVASQIYVAHTLVHARCFTFVRCCY